MVWAAEYDPWGNLQTEHNPENLKQSIRLPGQYHDTETGLYYNRHRYYDPKLGRYINQDPIGLNSGEPNFYAYPKNPLQGVDPLGLLQEAGGLGTTIIKKLKASVFDVVVWGACQHEAFDGLDNLEQTQKGKLDDLAQLENERFQKEYEDCFEIHKDHNSRMTCTEQASERRYQTIDQARKNADDYYQSTRSARILNSVFCD